METQREYYSEIVEETDSYRIFDYDYPKMGGRRFYKKATMWETYQNLKTNTYLDACDICKDETETGYEYYSHSTGMDRVLFAPNHYFFAYTCDDQTCINQMVSDYDSWKMNANHYWEYRHIADTNINKFRELMHEIDGKPETELLEKVQEAELTVAFGGPIGWNDKEAETIVKQVKKIYKKLDKKS